MRKVFKWSTQVRIWLPLTVAAFGVRVVVAGVLYGSHDTRLWAEFGQMVEAHGIGWMYDCVPIFNHPPAMGWLALACRTVGSTFHIRPAFPFKLVTVLADVGSCVVLYALWNRRSGVESARRAVVFFALSPLAILASSYHGNTDSLAAFLVILACWLLEDRASPFLAGLAAASAVNVKLIPFLLFPVLISRAATRGRQLAVLGGGIFCAIPFVPVLVGHWEGFRDHVLTYSPQPTTWGIGVLRLLASSAGLLDARVTPTFVSVGKLAILSMTFALCVRAWRHPEASDCYVLGGQVFSAFLVFAPAFAIQYLIYVAPLLFAGSLVWGCVYSATASVFAASIYVGTWYALRTGHSNFLEPIPKSSVLVGVLCWLVLAAFLTRTTRRGWAVTRDPATT